MLIMIEQDGHNIIKMKTKTKKKMMIGFNIISTGKENLIETVAEAVVAAAAEVVVGGAMAWCRSRNSTSSYSLCSYSLCICRSCSNSFVQLQVRSYSLLQ